jgi:hypothetical protein
MTRREMLRTSAATLAFGAIGSAWPLRAESEAPRAGTPWANKHDNLTATVDELVDVWNGPAPDGESWRVGCRKLQAILESAQAKSRRVRAVGAGWSLSPVAICPDVMINTLPLNYHAIGLPAAHVSSTNVDPAHLVFAQCGTSVAELNATLESNGLALPTSGASNGQTICGAISTGTHGSARRVGSMQDYMLGLHVLAEDGRSIWIEPASRPIVSDEFCHHIGATVVRNDRLFRAAVVGFGSFGIIHAVLFEATPIYLLDVRSLRLDWPDVADAACMLDTSALRLPDPGTEPFHLDVALNPYQAGRGQRGALVTAMYKRPFGEHPKRPTKDGKLVPGVDLLGIGGKLATVLPATIPAGVGAMFDGVVKARGEMVKGTHGQVFDRTELVGKSLSTEIGVDLHDTRAAVETLLQVAREYRYPGMFGLRYVQKSNALLAFTRFDTTCTIEMTGAGSRRTENFYDRAWAALDARKIPYTQHWGKVHRITSRNVRQRWGSAVDEWLDARRAFLSPAGRAMFSNNLLTDCGLDR